MINTLNEPIKYKIITTDDIIQLYEILSEAAEKFNKSTLDGLKEKYRSDEISEQFHHKIFPTYTIIVSNSDKRRGTELSELGEFLKSRKQPILSIQLELYIASNNSIRLIIDTQRKYSGNSLYEIIGLPETVDVISGKFKAVLNNMIDISFGIKIITKYYYQSSVFFSLLLYIYIIWITKIITSELSFPLYMFGSFLISTVCYILVLEIISTFKYSIELKLNNEYLDPMVRKRKTTGMIIGGISLFSTILGIVTYFK